MIADLQQDHTSTLMIVTEQHEIIISTVPHHKTLNKRLMRDADECEYDLSYQTNVMAKHTAWQT